jgi:NAD(P)-dependent dehydrogenase (short-subunit alcohol dehydrogenase family)
MTGERFAGKAVVVTGATGGIGSVLAARLANEGARLVLSARSSDRLAGLAEGLPGSPTLVPADLTEASAPELLVSRAMEECGKLDVLVNNAALDHAGDVLEAPVDDMRALFEVNVFAAFAMLQAAARAMVEAGGAIVNVTSRLASVGVPRMGVYGASKGALLSLTRAAAVELAQYEIRVNAVAPGMSRTPLYDTWLAQQDDPLGTEEEVLSSIPQGRLAEPADVASAIAFMASDDAAHITGTSLAVDGGYTAR